MTMKLNARATAVFKRLITGQPTESNAEAEALYAKIKPLDKPETYAVNSWGYDQTNTENVQVIGQAGSSMILIGNYATYAIAKRKYTNREHAYLDDVRSTSWEQAYTSDEIAESRQENMYFGH